MRIVLNKAERESAKSMKDAIASVLETEGIETSTQNIVDDYSKGISMFSDQKGNTIIDIETDFVKDIIDTSKKVGVLFIKAALPFVKTCERIGELLTDLDARWMTPSISKEEEGEIDG